MVTTHEVEQRLRRTMHAMADSAVPADRWPDLTARLAAAPVAARPPEEVPATPRRRFRRPVVAFAVAFTMVIATVGLVAALHPFGATDEGEVAGGVNRDELAYVPTYLPPEAPLLSGSFETELPRPTPTVALLQWADAAETRASGGLSVWEAEGPLDADLGEPDADGFWVIDLLASEGSPEIQIVGQRDDGTFMVVGAGTHERPVDEDLVRNVALAVRDGEPLPAAVGEWVDVTPPAAEPVAASVWYLNPSSADPDHLLTARIVEGVVDPRVELAKAPWQCEIVAVGAIPAARCWRENSGTLTWQIADGVAAALSSYGYPADELTAVAGSMVLMSPDDPRFPPEE